ncbi:MAG: UDP-2,3-diacylglucosamine diphosphatase LpxI [Candidatus Omnitrophica bacterium]|nr:UDP-2,3-diacylglucosamine diphosphatase LpxI [Candidatus Omnitrophota bacterium]
MSDIKRIGLLAGGGELPMLFADQARKNGITVIAFAAKGIASIEIGGHVDKLYWLDFSEVGKLPLLFVTNRVRNLVMLGTIPKSLFFKRDFSNSRAMSSFLVGSKDHMDDSMHREAARRMEKFGIRFVSPTEILSDLLPKKGSYTKREPEPREWDDIKFGKEMARALGKLDIGQTVVVQDRSILAVEAIEGTDEAIRRSGKYTSGGSVVVKTMKPTQDPRFDIPTVGLETIDSLVDAKCAVLAIEAEKTFFINRKESIEKADEHNISIVAV